MGRIILLVLSLVMAGETAMARDYTVFLRPGESHTVRDHRLDLATVVCRDGRTSNTREKSAAECETVGTNYELRVVTLFKGGDVNKAVVGTFPFNSQCAEARGQITDCGPSQSCRSCVCVPEGSNYSLKLISQPTEEVAKVSSLASFAFDSQCKEERTRNALCR